MKGHSTAPGWERGWMLDTDIATSSDKKRFKIKTLESTVGCSATLNDKLLYPALKKTVESESWIREQPNLQFTYLPWIYLSLGLRNSEAPSKHLASTASFLQRRVQCCVGFGNTETDPPIEFSLMLFALPSQEKTSATQGVWTGQSWSMKEAAELTGCKGNCGQQRLLLHKKGSFHWQTSDTWLLIQQQFK